MTPEGIVVAALESAGCRPRQRVGGGWSFRCAVPGHAHGDRKASGSLSEGADGRLLAWCGLGHTADEIAGAIGLTLADLFPADAPRRPNLRVVAGGVRTRPTPTRKAPRPGWPIVGVGGIIAVYNYTDAEGRLLYAVGRTTGKQFPTAHVDPEHGRVWGHPPEAMRVLFGLPAVLDGVERGVRVFVVEGEKDAIVLNEAFPDRINYVATTKAGGADSPWLPQYADVLRGANVSIVADRDPAGRKAAAIAARGLLGIAASIAILESRAGKDAADHVAAGFGLDDFLVLAADEPKAAQA
jgi:hypothetical protein